MSAPVDWPSSISVNGLDILPRDTIDRNESPFTLSEEVYDWGGEMWTIDGTLPKMDRAKSAAFKGFLLNLKGRKNPFLFPVPEPEPLGVATGTPLVNGAGQTGNVLDTQGWTPDVTGILKTADWLNLGTAASTRLYMVTADVDSDGSGNASIPLWPSLRSSPSDSAAVTVHDCKGLFRLTKNYGWGKDINKHFSFQPFSAMEALDGT